MDDFLKLSDDWGELQNGGSIVPYGIGRNQSHFFHDHHKLSKMPTTLCLESTVN